MNLYGKNTVSSVVSIKKEDDRVTDGFCQVTGEVDYGDALSFEEVGDAELALRREIEEAMHDMGAEHLDFDTSGDMLSFESGFFSRPEGIAHQLCDRLAPYFRLDMRGRIVVLERNLAPLIVFSLMNGSVKRLEIDVFS
ncbi:hypothetical protein [Desulfovibrio inopinatus]|uniref:hypothetical protein n=1 Tax=Desulfovibrio inopinatus TaxID=102109 RepID=UPI0003FDFAB1|nr:hypothetical protein [Desulfovibrio inopinatus]